MQIPNIPIGQDSWRRDMRMPFALLATLAILCLIVFLAISATGSTQAQNPPASTNDFALTWSAPSDGSITGYLYSTDNGLTWIQVTGTDGVIEGPAPGESTVVLIRDIMAQSTDITVIQPPNPGVTGPTPTPSTSNSRTGPEPTPVQIPVINPDPVPDLTVNGEDDGTTILSWTEVTPPPQAAAAGGPGIASRSVEKVTVESYKIHWSPDGSQGSWQLLAVVDADEARQYRDTDIQPGETRYYRVRATYSNGQQSKWSAAVSVTAEGELPVGPVLVAGTPEPGSIILSWIEAPSADSGDPVYSYELQWSETGQAGSWNALTYTNGDDREYYEWGLDPGQTRYYRVRAEYYSGTQSPWSATVSATVRSWPPQEPYLDAYAAGTTGIQLEWITYTQDENAPVTSHEIRVSSDGGESYQTLRSNLPPLTSYYYHTGLADGAERHYQVRSCNSAGCSEWAEAQAVSGNNPVPASPTASASSLSASSIKVAWTQPDDGGSAITSYEMECSEDGINWYYPEYCGGYTDAETRSMTHEGLLDSTTVYYRVRAHSDNGPGAWSATTEASTPRGAPSLIEDLTATEITDNSVTLTWSEPRGGPITSYVLERNEPFLAPDDDPDQWETVTALGGNVRTYTDTGLYSGSNYTYRVTPSNSIGQGPPSYEAWADTTGDPQWEPSELVNIRVASINASGVTFAWDPPLRDGGRPITHYKYSAGYDFSVPSDDSQTEACQDGSDISGTVPASTRQVTIPIKTCQTENGNTAWLEIYFSGEAVNQIGVGAWSYGYTSAWLPNRGGSLSVGASNITLAEGTSTSYTVRLSKAPVKDVRINFWADGDSPIVEQIEKMWWEAPEDWNLLTPDNWQQGVTITLNAPEDADTDDHVGVIHHAVVTNTRHLPGLADGHSTDVYDPSFHNVSGTSVKVVISDTGVNTGDGGPGS